MSFSVAVIIICNLTGPPIVTVVIGYDQVEKLDKIPVSQCSQCIMALSNFFSNKIMYCSNGNSEHGLRSPDLKQVAFTNCRRYPEAQFRCFHRPYDSDNPPTSVCSQCAQRTYSDDSNVPRRLTDGSLVEWRYRGPISFSDVHSLSHRNEPSFSVLFHAESRVLQPIFSFF